MVARVTRPEANLILLARAVYGLAPAAELVRLACSGAPAPDRLGPTSRRVLGETLASGSVWALARAGGWRRDGDSRVWERALACPLEFTPNVLRIMNWFLRTPLGDERAAPLELPSPLTLAEEVFAVFLLDRVKGSPCETVVARQLPWRESALVVLAHAAELARASVNRAGDRPWVEVPRLRAETHGVLVEWLREVLARSWLRAEHTKRDVKAPQVLIRMGWAQDAALAELFRVAHPIAQRARAAFLLDAGAAWLEPGREAADYGSGLRPELPLRERMEARRAAGSLLRGLLTLRTWDAEHRATGFVDDDYQLAQQLIRSWSARGERGFREAERLWSELRALPA